MNDGGESNAELKCYHCHSVVFIIMFKVTIKQKKNYFFWLQIYHSIE